MSVMSSAFSNYSLLLSSTEPSPPLVLCLISEPYSLVFTIYTITNILLLLPLCILVLFHGIQRWKQHHFSSTAATTGHSDIYTYHLATMEIMFSFGCILSCCGSYRTDSQMVIVGFCLYIFTWYGETFFHILTCVEHYLAAVHPITYLNLRKERGIRMKNIGICCIWVLSLVGSCIVTTEKVVSVTVMLCILPVSLIIISFCSLSVLCVLIRPGPGEQGRKQERVDRSKKRAFYITAAILGVLLLRCAWNLFSGVIFEFKTKVNKCVVVTGEMWFTLPSSLVLPLLYLQKLETLPCCKR